MTYLVRAERGLFVELLLFRITITITFDVLYITDV